MYIHTPCLVKSCIMLRVETANNHQRILPVHAACGPAQGYGRIRGCHHPGILKGVVAVDMPGWLALSGVAGAADEENAALIVVCQYDITQADGERGKDVPLAR